MKKSFLGLSILLFVFTSIYSQEIKTAPNYFQDVSAVYSKIKDYEADVDIRENNRMMKAHVSYKKPNYVRLDFSNPKEQTICFNGDELTIYLPDQNAILTQHVSNSHSSGANLATAQGLSLLSRYFSVAYATGPEAVALDDNNDERVIKLELRRKNLSENFRTIKMAISEDSKLIRRIEGITGNNETFTFDFTNYSLNKDIPNQRFIYTAPSSANEYNNFLLSE